MSNYDFFGGNKCKLIFVRNIELFQNITSSVCDNLVHSSREVGYNSCRSVIALVVTLVTCTNWHSYFYLKFRLDYIR